VFTDVKLPAGDEAALTIRLHLDHATAESRQLELSATIVPPEGESLVVRTNMTLAGGSSPEIVLRPATHPALRLRHPKLWWPVTCGDQPLYDLNIVTRVIGQVSDCVSRRFGIRSVGSFILPSGGRAFPQSASGWKGASFDVRRLECQAARDQCRR
jgi:exo-1,4-beta-D-glucosaminidase